MSTPNDGGRAFPRPAAGYSGSQEGMTLRDYFAGQALAAILVNASADDGSFKSAKELCDIAAPVAYIAADAMIVAREAKP
jgi:hypothetical protein